MAIISAEGIGRETAVIRMEAETTFFLIFKSEPPASEGGGGTAPDLVGTCFLPGFGLF